MSESSGNRLPQSVYRRRRLAAGGAALAVTAGLIYGATEVVDALKHYDDPIPAGCEVTVGDGETAWSVATDIDKQLPDVDTEEVMFNLRRANPDKNLGQIAAWTNIGIPEQYCSIVEQPGFGQ
jgi:hypothetical protein